MMVLTTIRDTRYGTSSIGRLVVTSFPLAFMQQRVCRIAEYENRELSKELWALVTTFQRLEEFFERGGRSDYFDQA